jgi:tRNA A-37 threonylcarbamoyl transferase component Bud32
VDDTSVAKEVKLSADQEGKLLESALAKCTGVREIRPAFFTIMSAPPMPAFPTAEELGNCMLQYEVQECIQVGIESAVYKARQPALDRQVMIRVLAEPPAEAVHRLMERLRSRAKLVHPRIVAVYDFGRTHGGHLYLITEHVDGRLLSDLILERQITPKLAYPLALQLCDSLAMIHEANTTHGALNTRTLLVDREWQLKVTGIGMAENSLGEISWLHENQATVEQDLYALGLVLHEMFGKEALPEDGRVSRNLPPAFAAIIRRCVHPEAARRFASAGEVKDALVDALRTQKQAAAPAPTSTPVKANPVPAGPAHAPRADAQAAAVPSPAAAPPAPRPAPYRPPPVQRYQPSFGKKLDDFLWACLRASLHLVIFAITAGIIFVSYLLKDKIVIGDKDDKPREEPAMPGEILGKLPAAPQLTQPSTAPMSAPLTLPKQDPRAELDRQYQAAVQKAAAEALDKVRLNDLPFLQKELQRLQNGEALPSADEADTPIALKQLRDQYRQQSAALAP